MAPTSTTRQGAGWAHFAHDADTGVRGFGPDLATAFAQAALALSAVVTDPDGIAADRRIDIACAGDDPEQLLYDWLNAIVFEMATRGMVFGRFEVELDADGLRGAAWGEVVDTARHEPAAEIKGATYTELAVARDEAGIWVAQCVVDV